MKLFVAGLPYDMDDRELQEIFGDYGTVNSAKVIMDRDTGKSRGFGFVEFADENQAREAIKALDGATISGKALTVKVAEDKPGTERRESRSRGFSSRSPQRERR